MNFNKPISLLILIILSCSACSLPENKNQNDNSSTSTSPSALFHIPYVSSEDLIEPVMVLVLHGDAPFNNPSYQYLIAKKIAAENKNTVAVGVLRPGYTDNEGNLSKGVRGEATGDNYTPEVLKSINTLTQELEKKYKPSKVILVGHSGGAAISANLIAQYPETYSDAVLISCPCDLHLWRNHMKQFQPETSIWDMEVSSLSPIEELQTIDEATQITVVHGDNDEIVPIHIAQKYVKALERNNKKVHFEILDNQGHEVALNSKVFEIIAKLVK